MTNGDASTTRDEHRTTRTSTALDRGLERALDEIDECYERNFEAVRAALREQGWTEDEIREFKRGPDAEYLLSRASLEARLRTELIAFVNETDTSSDAA